jgi:predicted ATPase/DNA-binding NarL/FixJ family response regulator
VSEQVQANRQPPPGRFRAPLQPTPLIGRERALADCCARLRDPGVRLLTITGPPGVGKTRLAVEVATHLSGAFDDGAAFVDLASLGDPELVLRTIAQVVGMVDRPGAPLLEQLQTLLRDRHLLLVLDNFEHVIAAAPKLTALFSDSPDLKVLATSREPLHLSWEHEYPLPPLEAPDPAWLVRPEAALGYPAVALFAQRARAVDPGFSVNAENGKTVAAICRRVDGLPLAIELAAARVKLFPPEALLSRMEDGLGVLAGGTRDAAERHRTLRDAIAWSYELLPPEEQGVLRHLAVFAGGCTLEAASAVVPGAQSSLLDVIGSLVEKSLVVSAAYAQGEPRFRLLEVIREFGREQLARAGEQHQARHRHMVFFAALAARAAPELRKARVGHWLDTLERESDNFRAALDWSEGNEPQTGLGIAARLGRFWLLRGHIAEGRTRLEAAIAAAGAGAPPAARADALDALGRLTRAQGEYAKTLACCAEALAIRRSLDDVAGMAATLHVTVLTLYAQGDFGSARATAEESVRLARASGDRDTLATTLNGLGVILERQGELESADQIFNEALATYSQLGIVSGVAGVLGSLGLVAHERGDAATATRYHEQSVALAREIGDRWSLGIALNNLGEALRDLGEGTAARAAIEESLAIGRDRGDRRGVAFALDNLGGLARARGDVPEAARMYAEALQIRRSLGEKLEISRTLDNMAALAVATHESAPAVRLAAAASTLRQSTGAGKSPAEAPARDALEQARRKLGETAYQSAWEAGSAMTVEQAVEYALAHLPRDAGKPAARERLSRREREVAVLITRGLTNRQIAAELVISERTADTHVQNILNKLGFSTRAQVAAWAAREGLDAGA